MSRTELQSAIDALGKGGLSLVVDDLAHPVSGARAVSDTLIEVYPTGDDDERPYRIDVTGFAKLGKGLEFETDDRIAFQLFPIGSVKLGDRLQAYKDGSESLEEDDES